MAAFLTKPTVTGTIGPGGTITFVEGGNAPGWTHDSFVLGRGPVVGAEVPAANNSYTFSGAAGDDDAQQFYLTEFKKGPGGKIASKVSDPFGFDTLRIAYFDFTAVDGTPVADRRFTTFSPPTLTASQGGISGIVRIGDENNTYGAAAMTRWQTKDGSPALTAADGYGGVYWNAGQADYDVAFTIRNDSARFHMGFMPVLNSQGDQRGIMLESRLSQRELNWNGSKLTGTSAKLVPGGDNRVSVNVRGSTKSIAIKLGGKQYDAGFSYPAYAFNAYSGLFNFNDLASRNTPTIDNLEIRKPASPTVLSINDVEMIGPIGAQRGRFSGTYEGTAPTGFTAQFRLRNGLTVLAAMAMTVISIANGAWAAETTVSLPLGAQDRPVAAIIRKANKPEDAAVTDTYRDVYAKPRIYGGNLGANGPFGIQPYTYKLGLFADWRENMTWEVLAPNGTGTDFDEPPRNAQTAPAGKYYNSRMPKLRELGIVDSNNNVIAWPANDPRIVVRAVLPRWPLNFEMGHRTLRLPATVGFSITGGGVTVGPTNGFASGVYDTNVTGSYLENNYLNLDYATFKPMTGWSWRHSTDTTTNHVTDSWIAQYASFRVFRFMDAWSCNAGGDYQDFDNRFNIGFTNPDVPIEICNRIGAHMYMTLGHRVSPAQGAKAVAYIHARLAPGLRIMADWFNEAWGGIQPLFWAMASYAAISGRTLTPYGTPLDPSLVDVTTDDGFASTNSGIPFAMAQGRYLVARRYGKDMLLWRAKRAIAVGTKQPAFGTLDNDDWQYIGDPSTNADLEYGARFYAMTVACQAVCDRLDTFLNVSRFENFSAGSFGTRAMTFPITPGGQDKLINVVTGYTHACYTEWGVGVGNDFATVKAKPEGAQRIEAILVANEAAAPEIGKSFASSRAGFRALLDASGLYDKRVICGAYEGGATHTQYRENAPLSEVPVSLATDIGNAQLDPRFKAINATAVETAFANGASFFVGYSFNPRLPGQAQNAFDFGHLIGLGDTTTPVWQADLELGAKYRQIEAQTPTEVDYFADGGGTVVTPPPNPEPDPDPEPVVTPLPTAPRFTAAARMATTATATPPAGIDTATPIKWDAPLDPSDNVLYQADWTDIIPNEGIDTIEEITVSPNGVALGIMVESDERAPIVDKANKRIGVWITGDPARPNLPDFAKDGVLVGVKIRIRTDSTPYRVYERTWALTVRQL